MLYNLPENVQIRSQKPVFEKEARSDKQAHDESGAFASWIDCRAIQKVRQARLPLPERQGTWTRLLPFDHFSGRENAVVLPSSEIKEARCPVPQEPQKASRTQRSDRGDQPPVARARGSWKPRQGLRRRGNSAELKPSGIFRWAKLSIVKGYCENFVAPSFPCYLTV